MRIGPGIEQGVAFFFGGMGRWCGSAVATHCGAVRQMGGNKRRKKWVKTNERKNLQAGRG